jgi:hypothetical protein
VNTEVRVYLRNNLLVVINLKYPPLTTSFFITSIRSAWTGGTNPIGNLGEELTGKLEYS